LYGIDIDLTVVGHYNIIFNIIQPDNRQVSVF